ncbi:hypothetical protein Tco_1122729 [Tanacetum coccineum]|uniref:Integrase, catalytic region, zinc finger, CCHC-type, peptidase aspartic, catalytic n=1 Tax=Tanacetum coccineum TaxID=301880 RepID=A0ABQ5J519_9ASTR
MTTLADKAILSGADNRPPMLEKDMYDSWKSIMELYMMNRQHGRMILESVENGPLIWPTIEENGMTRPRKYSELTPADAIQADCDVKVTNIILQGLPPEVDESIDAINHMMSFLSAVVTSWEANFLATDTSRPTLQSKVEAILGTKDCYWYNCKGKDTCAIVIPDSEETLMLAEESRSKMLLKQQDPMVLEKKVNTTPVDYANSMNSSDPSPSCRPTKVEVLKELPKVSMVNTSLKKLKHHLAGFDVVVKERTTATAITEGSWGFEHTKACFRDEIIPFVKALKDLFNTFDQYLIDELSKVQNVFHQMEQAMEQHRLE